MAILKLLSCMVIVNITISRNSTANTEIISICMVDVLACTYV